MQSPAMLSKRVRLQSKIKSVSRGSCLPVAGRGDCNGDPRLSRGSGSNSQDPEMRNSTVIRQQPPRITEKSVTKREEIVSNLSITNYFGKEPPQELETYQESVLVVGVAAADTILLQPVLSWTSSFVVPMALMNVSVDTVHPSLLLSSSLSSPGWYHLQSLSSYVVLVSLLYVAKPPESRFPAPLCDTLYLQSLLDVFVSHMVS